MNAICLLTTAGLATLCAPVWADNLSDAFKGKMKEGLYDYKVDMDMGQMPGIPAGMGKRSSSFQHCLTAEDIDKGRMGRGGRDGKGGEDCQVKNFKMSGNTANYTMACGNEMTSDNTITFTYDGYKMDMNMVMSQSGQAMKMTQHVESRYLGPCKP
jgi:hypothetical protein